MTVTIGLAISRDVLMTSNQRTHWAAKARQTRAIREMAFVMCKHERARLLPAATLEVVTKWGDHRVRDAANIEPTSKAAVDGCVDAGVLIDDSSRYLKHTGYAIDPETHKIPGIACFVTLVFTEVTP